MLNSESCIFPSESLHCSEQCFATPQGAHSALGQPRVHVHMHIDMSLHIHVPAHDTVQGEGDRTTQLHGLYIYTITHMGVYACAKKCESDAETSRR